MFILSPLGPLHYSRCNWLTVRIDELPPVTRELCRGHPFRQWFRRACFGLSACLNQSNYFLCRAFKDVSDFCFQIQVFVEHGGNRLVQQMCQANFVRNFDRRVFESVRIDQVTALICRQSHTSMGFANSFTLSFPTPCELAGANSLHYATAYPPSTHSLDHWTEDFPTRKNLFLVFSRARNRLKIRPQVIDFKPLD